MAAASVQGRLAALELARLLMLAQRHCYGQQQSLEMMTNLPHQSHRNGRQPKLPLGINEHASSISDVPATSLQSPGSSGHLQSPSPGKIELLTIAFCTS
jgi:hypothetical protein